MKRLNLALIAKSLLLISFVLMGCDYIKPQREFTLAIPKNDFTYNYAAEHFKSVLEQAGFKIDIVHTKSVEEAVELVASNKADLTLAMNHSVYLFDSVGSGADKLRTIVALFRRFMFIYVPKDSTRNFISPS